MNKASSIITEIKENISELVEVGGRVDDICEEDLNTIRNIYISLYSGHKGLMGARTSIDAKLREIKNDRNKAKNTIKRDGIKSSLSNIFDYSDVENENIAGEYEVYYRGVICKVIPAKKVFLENKTSIPNLFYDRLRFKAFASSEGRLGEIYNYQYKEIFENSKCADNNYHEKDCIKFKEVFLVCGDNKESTPLPKFSKATEKSDDALILIVKHKTKNSLYELTDELKTKLKISINKT